MGTSESSSERTVDLFLSPGATDVWHRQQSVIERIERLERTGDVDRFRIRVWGRRVSAEGPLSGTRFHRSSMRTIRKFERWCERSDRSIDLPFQHQSVHSEFTDRECKLVRTPSICVATYEDGDLSGVDPCRIDDTACSVEDFVSHLEADGETSPEAERLMAGLGGAGERA